jgi:hypothetical protein
MRNGALGVAVMTALLSSACDGEVSARGRVSTAEGAPLAGATVVLDGPGYPQRWRTESGADGCFQLGGTTAPNHEKFRMTITKEGFGPVTAEVSGGEVGPEFAVTLKTLQEPSGGVALKGEANSVKCNWLQTPSGVDAKFGPR